MEFNIKDNFQDFSYAKKHHFNYFDNYDLELYKRKIDLGYCDLKAYQDLLVFAYIRENIPPGSKMLDIGGGDSRILNYFKDSYECWNLDKLEGIGNGAFSVNTDGYRLVKDYIGNFNKELPENYFDFIFSISALEHVPNGSEKHRKLHENICLDMDRILKPGGHSLHLLDITISSRVKCWFNDLALVLSGYFECLNSPVDFEKIIFDKDVFVISEQYFNDFWKGMPSVRDYEDCMPTSLNILWIKPLTETKTKSNTNLKTEINQANKYIDKPVMDYREEIHFIEEEMQKGNLTLARTELNKILAIEPENIMALNDLATLEIMSNNKDTAVSILEHILSVNPNNEIALENLKALGH